VAITSTPLHSPKLFEPPETTAAATAITSKASTSSTRSTTTVALASPTPILTRGAIAPMRSSSPSLKGDTELSAKPIAVTAVASPRPACGADARRITCQRQPRTRMKARKATSASTIHPGDARSIAAPTSLGCTLRNNP